MPPDKHWVPWANRHLLLNALTTRTHEGHSRKAYLITPLAPNIPLPTGLWCEGFVRGVFVSNIGSDLFSYSMAPQSSLFIPMYSRFQGLLRIWSNHSCHGG